MPRLFNRVGERFGKLVVLSAAGRNKLKKVLWNCACDCGNTTVVVSGSLVTGNTTSCGCVIPNFKHGGWKKSSYNTWRAMMRRCYKPQDKDYARYGGAGVKVCERWRTYTNFAADMGEPVDAETLDRKDPYGDYTPDNCRWASLPVQARNTRVRKTTQSGVTGVHRRGNKWMAEITVQKKKYYSKICTTLEEAVTARKALELTHWGVV